MKRRTIPTKTLLAENAAITQFLFDRALPQPGAKMPLQEVFEVYQDWRKQNQMPKSELTLDGFGRMFPHTYRRGPGYWPAAKHALKCVFDFGLRESAGKAP